MIASKVIGALGMFVVRAAALRTTFHEQQTSAQLMQDVGALLQHGSDDEMLSKFRSLAQATPGTKAALNDALNTTITDIGNNVMSKIVAGHTETQAALDTAISDLELSSSAASNQKAIADSADEEWYSCVKTEKDKLIAVEEAQQDLEQAQTNQIQSCQDQDASSAFSASPSTASFNCDFSVDGNCAQQQQNYEMAMMKAVESDMQSKRDQYIALKTDCDEKKTLRQQAHTAHQELIAAWKDKQEICLTKHETRQLSVCLFGSELKRKCEEVYAFKGLITEIETGSQDGLTGSVYSDPDRVQEWSTAALTKCMLKQVVDGAQIDAVALTHCTENLDIGVLNKYGARFAASSEGCSEATIAFFNGKGWDTPRSDPPVSTEYVLKPFQPVFRASDESPLCCVGFVVPGGFAYLKGSYAGACRNHAVGDYPDNCVFTHVVAATDGNFIAGISQENRYFKMVKFDSWGKSQPDTGRYDKQPAVPSTPEEMLSRYDQGIAVGSKYQFDAGDGFRSPCSFSTA